MAGAFTKKDTLAVKGGAILAMICLHCFRVPELYAGYPVNFAPLAESQVNHICTYCKICVGMFAFLSGYGLSKSLEDRQGSLSAWCGRRYLKSIGAFWPVYVLCLLAGCLLDGRTVGLYFTGSAPENAMNLLLGALGLSHIFRTPMFVNEWWYLSAMVVFIFVTPLLDGWVGRGGWLLPTAVLVAVPRILPIGFQGGTEIVTFLAPLLLGVIFARERVFERLDAPLLGQGWGDRLVKLALYGAAALVGYKLTWLLPAAVYWEVYYGVIPLTFLLFFHQLVRCVPPAEKLFAFLGKYSGDMYFIHTVFLYVYLKDLLYSMPWFGLTILATLVVSLAFSMALEGAKALIRKALSST